MSCSSSRLRHAGEKEKFFILLAATDVTLVTADHIHDYGGCLMIVGIISTLGTKYRK